jgi:hypothetical protein
MENSITYSSNISQGSVSTFTLNLSSDGSQSVTSTFYYNGVAYTTTKVGSDTEMRFTRSITNSLVGVNTKD